MLFESLGLPGEEMGEGVCPPGGTSSASSAHLAQNDTTIKTEIEDYSSLSVRARDE